MTRVNFMVPWSPGELGYATVPLMNFLFQTWSSTRASHFFQFYFSHRSVDVISAEHGRLLHEQHLESLLSLLSFH